MFILFIVLRHSHCFYPLCCHLFFCHLRDFRKGYTFSLKEWSIAADWVAVRSGSTLVPWPRSASQHTSFRDSCGWFRVHRPSASLAATAIPDMARSTDAQLILQSHFLHVFRVLSYESSLMFKSKCFLIIILIRHSFQRSCIHCVVLVVAEAALLCRTFIKLLVNTFILFLAIQFLLFVTFLLRFTVFPSCFSRHSASSIIYLSCLSCLPYKCRHCFLCPGHSFPLYLHQYPFRQDVQSITLQFSYTYH